MANKWINFTEALENLPGSECMCMYIYIYICMYMYACMSSIYIYIYMHNYKDILVVSDGHCHIVVENHHVLTGES